MAECIGEVSEHKGCEDEQMESFEGCIEPFVVSGEPSESGGPGEASFDHPAARQEHEASFRHEMLDYLEPEAMLFCRFGGVWTSVVLIDEGQFDRVAGNLLHLLGQGRDLFANRRRRGWLRHQPPSGPLGVCASVACERKGKDGAKDLEDGNPDTKSRPQTKDDPKGKDNAQPKGIGAVIIHSLEQPVVWAPVGGLVLVLPGVSIPHVLQTAVKFLGSTSGAVSLFASGIILQAQKPTISWPIAITTLARNLVIPGTAFLILKALHVDHQLMKTAVLALALPAAAMQITLALEYQTGQQENASFLLYSNVLSIATVAMLISLVK